MTNAGNLRESLHIAAIAKITSTLSTGFAVRV
jgi:hypothetical protein